MQIKTIPSPWQNWLGESYTESSHPVHSFYEYHPYRVESYQTRLQYLDENEDLVKKNQLADVLESYHQPELLHPAVQKNLRRFREKGSVVVIGGQQAGLLTGPMYTIHKVIYLIQIAKREEERLGRPVIPVFWIAGEDHDLAEVDHIWYRNEEGQLSKHHYSAEAPEKKIPIAKRKLSKESFHRWLDELADHMPDTVYKHEWLSHCKGLINETITWSRYFARLLHSLFGEYGLLMIDSADPQLRAMEKPFFESLIEQSGELNDLIRETIRDFEKNGFATTLYLQEKQGLLFMEIDEERHTLFQSQQVWMSREGDKWAANELKEKWLQLSNNVATRPLMQEYLFPTLLFLSGASELAYWGCLKPAFQQMGLQMPILYPRPSVTLVERHVKKRMELFSLSLEEPFEDLEKRKLKWFRKKYEDRIYPLFRQAEEQLEQMYQPLISQLGQSVGKHMMDVGYKNKSRAKRELEYLESYAIRMLSEQSETRERQWNEIIQSLYPIEKPQERVYNLISFWNQYGLHWIDEVMKCSILVDDHKHQCVIL